MILDAGTGVTDGVRNALLVAGAFVILGSLAGFALIDPEADLVRDVPDHDPDWTSPTALSERHLR
jgi:hypothetical protein